MLQIAKTHPIDSTASKKNKHKVKQLSFISEFACDSSKCINHCCEYETISVEQDCVDLYRKKAPKLLNVIEKFRGNFRMITENRVCKNMDDNGLCSIQNKYGIDYQPQTCHTYPRRYSLFDNQLFVTASFPCSELIRAAINTQDAFSWVETDLERVPVDIADKFKQGAFKGIDKKKLLEVYDAVLQFIDEGLYNSEETLLRLLLLSELFEDVRRPDYPIIIQRLIRIANSINLNTIYQKNEKSLIPELLDRYVHSLLATTKDYRMKEYNETVVTIINFLDKFDRTARRDIYKNKIAKSKLDDLLKRYLKAKVSEIIFPLSNWGNCVDDLLFMIWGYAGIRLAFIECMDELDNGNNQDKVVRIIYDFERNLYHNKQNIQKYFRKNELLGFDKLVQLLIS